MWPISRVPNRDFKAKHFTHLKILHNSLESLYSRIRQLWVSILSQSSPLSLSILVSAFLSAPCFPFFTQPNGKHTAALRFVHIYVTDSPTGQLCWKSTCPTQLLTLLCERLLAEFLLKCIANTGHIFINLVHKKCTCVCYQQLLLCK